VIENKSFPEASPIQESFFSSFNYFKALFNNTCQNTVVLMNAQGIITTVNAAFTECFGYTAADIIGKHVEVLFTEEERQKELPQKELKTVLSEGQSSDNNYLVTKDRTPVWVSGESILVTNQAGDKSILKIIQNIHQQKLAETCILRLRDFNEKILTSIEDAVVVLDVNMKILKANKAFNDFFGKDYADVFALNFGDVIKPFDTSNDLRDSIQSTINTSKGFFNKQLEFETSANEKKIFTVSCSYMREADEANNLLVVIHDITVFKQVEKEREDIIGFVAHELRNPLANVVLCNEIMSEALKENKTEEIAKMLVRSKNNVMRLNKMIAELYDATSINSGNLKLDMSMFNLGEMINEAIETVEILQPAYNIIVEGSGDINVHGDRYRLIQVVTNYLSNGIKYSDGKTDVILGIKHEESSITVSVKDEGLGISKNQLPYIFERFFRAEKTKNLEGIGLGLYLCRQIIQAHKGRVWAESEEGKGSTFYFSIPVN
jgi:PAS domain S-box-containing protein